MSHTFFLICLTTLIAKQTTCENDWTRGPSTEKEYILYDDDTTATFEEAKAICLIVNARLPQIANAWENLAVRTMMPSDGTVKLIWLGASRTAQRSYSWLDGSQLSYTNWNKDWPQYGFMGVDLRSSDGKWENDNLPSEKYVVCERDFKETLIKQSDVNVLKKEISNLRIELQSIRRQQQMQESMINKNSMQIKQLSNKM